MRKLETLGQTKELISDSLSHLMRTTTSTLCHQKNTMMLSQGHHRNPRAYTRVPTGNAVVPLESLSSVQSGLEKTLEQQGAHLEGRKRGVRRTMHGLRELQAHSSYGPSGRTMTWRLWDSPKAADRRLGSLVPSAPGLAHRATRRALREPLGSERLGH